LGRIGLLNGGGGDLVQIENTARELRKLGVKVDIKTEFGVDMSHYDLVHIFQLDWNADNYFYTNEAKKYGKPLVLSPIHHNVEEVKKFDDTYVFDYRRISKVVFRNQFSRDVFKNFYRALFDLSKIKPVLYSIFLGLKNMHVKVLQQSDAVLVQTNLEAKDLEYTYGVKLKKWKIVVNGVGEQFLDHSHYKNPFHFEDYIICVGRVEPRKNQLSIIYAVEQFRKEENIDVKLVFIGRYNVLNHLEYTLRFKQMLKKYPWIIHIEKIPYEVIPNYFHFAKVGVSASWFETTGLTSLDALFCGTNAVAAGDRAKEYLGDFATYCRPDDVKSIKDAIRKEYYAKRPVLPAKMKKEYTWEYAAKQTLDVYSELLKEKE
jgi:glycosyltransferase involved in cell wall biosynthesis